MNASGSIAKLVRPDYIRHNREGRVVAIYCKLCGVEIAGLIHHGLRRHKNIYAEVKMQFEDGSFHVTNMCMDCASKNRTNRTIMTAAMQCDLAHLAEECPGVMRDLERKNPRVIVIDTSQRGVK